MKITITLDDVEDAAEYRARLLRLADKEPTSRVLHGHDGTINGAIAIDEDSYNTELLQALRAEIWWNAEYGQIIRNRASCSEYDFGRGGGLIAAATNLNRTMNGDW